MSLYLEQVQRILKINQCGNITDNINNLLTIGVQVIVVLFLLFNPAHCLTPLKAIESNSNNKQASYGKKGFNLCCDGMFCILFLDVSKDALLSCRLVSIKPFNNKRFFFSLLIDGKRVVKV